MAELMTKERKLVGKMESEQSTVLLNFGLQKDLIEKI
jgi:hypothetical protein